ncbi:MAG: beta-ketoacyl-[acyl-carrier-protein] synthase family protein [Oligoflexia bacterium]|nr:beta-ketoacyl-[acyl-carrier-protein] synthase family protein [Oligoflexia bacterium]
MSSICSMSSMGHISNMSDQRRVVVTSYGLICPLGNGVDESFTNLVEGVSGETFISRFDASSFPAKVACQIREDIIDELQTEFVQYKKIFPREVATVPLNDLYLLAALSEAIKIKTTTIKGPIPIVIGAELSPIDFHWLYSYYTQRVIEKKTDADIALDVNSFDLRSPYKMLERIEQYFSKVTNAIPYGFSEKEVTSLACASSTAAIIHAFRKIRRGDANCAIAGGTFAGIIPHMLMGFSLLDALSKNLTPGKASRPFDCKRDGFVLSEGAGVLVLEELQSAISRGATIYGEVMGGAITADAFKMSDMDPSGQSQLMAMSNALDDAKIEKEMVDLINTHGTSTRINDQVESLAIASLFKERAAKIFISANKSALGHSIAACGVIESIFTLKSLEHSIVPPIVNFEKTDVVSDLVLTSTLNYPAQKICDANISIALKNSFAFGGSNCSLVFRKWNGNRTVR